MRVNVIRLRAHAEFTWDCSLVYPLPYNNNTLSVILTGLNIHRWRSCWRSCRACNPGQSPVASTCSRYIMYELAVSTPSKGPLQWRPAVKDGAKADGVAHCGQYIVQLASSRVFIRRISCSTTFLTLTVMTLLLSLWPTHPMVPSRPFLPWVKLCNTSLPFSLNQFKNFATPLDETFSLSACNTQVFAAGP